MQSAVDSLAALKIFHTQTVGDVTFMPWHNNLDLE
jgi:hypothetical protein